MKHVTLDGAVRCALVLTALLSGMPWVRVSAQSGSPGQEPAARAAPVPLAELACELVGGRAYVPIEISGHALHAVLDTGAGASLMDLALAEEWELPSRSGVTARGIGGEPVSGLLLDGVTAQLAGLNEPIFCALPLASLTAWEGRPVQVILGQPFFAGHIVEFDYAARRVRVFDAQADFEASVVLPLRFVEGRPVTAATVTVGGTDYEVEAHLDGGASRSGLTARFLAAHPLEVKTTPRFSIAGGVGGRARGRLFRPDAVTLGGLRFAQPVLTMSEPDAGLSGAEARYDLLIGSDLLRRCRVVVDYPHERMLLAPGEDVHAPFEVDRSGLCVQAEAGNLRRYVVFEVLEGSSAAMAGVVPGDMLESVDGKPAGDYSLHELRELFKSPVATGWTLALRRGEQAIEVELAARAII